MKLKKFFSFWKNVRPIYISLFLLFIFSSTNVFSVEDKHKHLKKAKATSMKISKNIYFISGEGGNIGLSAGKDGILIIDSQFSRNYKKIKREIRKIKKGKITYLLNTHWHGDHTGGNHLFGKKSIIVAHENVRKRLSKDQHSHFFKKTTKKQEENGLPVITFKQNMKIYFNDEEIELVHFSKGHTDGDAVIFFHGSKVVHLGDYFFSGNFPFVDLEAGGNVIQYHKNVKKLLKVIPKDYKIIPGHGPISDYSKFKEFEQMISMSIERVKDKKNIGSKKDEIRLPGVLNKFKNYDSGLIKEKAWVKLIVESL